MNEEQIKALIAKILGETGVMTKQEFNSTAALIRGLKDSIDGLQNTNPLDTLVTAGLLEKDAQGQYKAKAQQAPGKKDAEPEWQVQLRQMQEQIAAKDKALAAEKAKREESELKAAVIAAMEKAGAVNAQRDYVHVLSAVKRAEDGTFHTVKKDEFGVEANVPLETYFTEFLGKNPELKKAQGHPGSGTPSGVLVAGQSGSPDINSLANMSVDQYVAARKAGK